MTHSGGCRHVLNKEDALGLNDKKVDELVDVANNGVQGLFGHGVVAARAGLTSEAVVEGHLAGDFGGNRHTEGHPGDLEGVPQNIEIPGGKDESNDARVGNARGPFGLLG